jgi:hypothetical protein
VTQALEQVFALLREGREHAGRHSISNSHSRDRRAEKPVRAQANYVDIVGMHVIADPISG